MLEITIPATDGWDDEKEEFVICEKEQTITLEHSLVSLSKWESKWKKAFFKDNNKTSEEIIDYIKCMTLTKNVDESVYYRLSPDNINAIKDYIADPMTATTIASEPNGKVNNEVVTAELIYYWMIALTIPFECQKWHINRLLTLIRVCNVKNNPPKKMSQSQLMSRNAALNAARRKQLHTKG